MGVVYQQGTCATCVGAVIASAATAAVASALRVDARSLAPLAPSYAYHCAWAFGEPGALRSCGYGWTYEDALRSMQLYPAAFFMNHTCLGGADLTALSSTPQQLAAACNAAKSACSVPAIKCKSTSLAEGIWAVQRHIRRCGDMGTEAGTAFFECKSCSHWLRTDCLWQCVVLPAGMVQRSSAST